MPAHVSPRYRGIFPVVPTTFHDDGSLHLNSQKRCLDFMIDSGVDGRCILANFSERFLVSDDEREVLTRTSLEHVAGRVPVIVTPTHTSTKICAKEGGVIACEAPRSPWPPMHPEVRRQLIEIARRLDPLVLRWGH